MIKCVVKGKFLNSGEKEKKDGTKSLWIDLYLDNCGQTIRVNDYRGEPLKFGDEKTLFINVYNGSNDLYITFDKE